MIVERIKQFIDEKGIAISAFEKSVGMSNASFGKSVKYGGAIGTDKLENILSIYPDLSPSWLLTGEGSMLRPSAVGEPEPREAMPLATTPSIQPQFESLIATIREQAEEIGRLKARIDMLERRPDAAPIG